MDFVETDGDTIDAAIDNALKQLGVAREQVTIDILSEGRKGILGFGAQKAKVRAALRKKAVEISQARLMEAPIARPAFAAVATVAAEIERPPAVAIDVTALTEKAKAALVEILHFMGMVATVEQKAAANGEEIILEVKAENSGLLIGRKGQTLEALQYLVDRIAGERQGSEGPHVVIDIENYRERRRRALEDMALRLGEKAKRQRKTVTVDALSAADRRVIHAALQDDPWLTTKSLGQGSYRRLLIIPEGDRKKKDDARAASAEQSSGRPQRGAAKPDLPNVTEEEENES
ncbi:MAG TPA: RNA-binding cell elongation regulator Jag/EloR [Candidatus Binatia bacterium]